MGVVPVVDPTAATAPILAKLDEVDARIARWSREAALAGLRATDIKVGADALEAERTVLEDQLATAAPAAMTWEQLLDPANTRAWLDAVIDRIEIAPAKSMGARFDTGRVEIVWRAQTTSV